MNIKEKVWERSGDDLRLITYQSGSYHVWENMWAEVI